MLSMLGKIKTWTDILKYFLFSPENIIGQFMQIVSWVIQCMKCQILFSRESKKNITNLSSAEFAHSMLIIIRNWIDYGDTLKDSQSPRQIEISINADIST